MLKWFCDVKIYELYLLFAVRIGIIYTLSAFVGALVAALFIQNTPAVGSSGALFGLLGTLLSQLVWNWKFLTKRVLFLSLICLSLCFYYLSIDEIFMF